MEITGRDKITQTGSSPSVKIDNRKVEEKKHWYQTWWGQLAIGVAIIIAGAILTNLLGLTKIPTP